MAQANTPLDGPGLPGANGQRSALPWEPARPTPAPETRPANGSGLVEGAHGVHALQQVKGRVHRRLLERLNLSNLDRLERQQVADGGRKGGESLVNQESG